jgi:hypothetical protein
MLDGISPYSNPSNRHEQINTNSHTKRSAGGADTTSARESDRIGATPCVGRAAAGATVSSGVARAAGFGTLNHGIPATVMFANVRSYSKLKQQIHVELRVQHPEWIQANGECPTCEEYELRFAELLAATEKNWESPPTSTVGGLLARDDQFITLGA